MPRPEAIIEDALRATVGSPAYIARIIADDLRAAGLLNASRRDARRIINQKKGKP